MIPPADEYRKIILATLLPVLEECPDVLGAWEGGSAANDTTDQFSDIDLCVLARAPIQDIIELTEYALRGFGVSHGWQPSKSFWGEGLVQRVIVLKDAPPFFCVDVSVFDEGHPALLAEFLEVERHGSPRILFDRSGLIRGGHTDAAALFARQQLRVNDLSNGFPIFKSLALKELARGNPIDAIGFYQNGLLRPFIEVLGMLRRPFRYDFGMRYLHRSFSPEEQRLIEDLSYVPAAADLPGRILKLEEAFRSAVDKAKARKTLELSSAP